MSPLIADHPYIIVFLIGCLTALAELISRYDRIVQIFKFGSSWLYFFINGFSGVLAYWFITEYNLDFGGLTNNEIGKILLAGTSSMIILRSSFANIRYGNKNIEAGFAAITQVFLNAADRSFDRKRSIDDYNKIKEIMEDINFKSAKIDLPITCLSIMKNVPIEEQTLLGEQVSKLSEDSQSNKAKSINLGILIARTTGIKLLQTVVESLKDRISVQSEAVNVSSKKLKKIDEMLTRLK